MAQLTRRSLLAGIGLSAAAVATAPVGVAQAAERPRSSEFFGPHQAGISQPPQASLQFAALNIAVRSRDAFAQLMKDWTTAAAAMTHGMPIGEATSGSDAVPIDTGEALDLPPANLTITFGFGPTLFARLGLASRQPRALVGLPPFPGDTLDPSRVGGDLCIQACADDQQVAMHAVRNLLRVAGARASTAWSQVGFNRSAALAPVRETPRNLFGFRDGTNNISSDDRAGFNRFVWAHPEDGTPWMAGGSYLAVRRIRMLTVPWDDAVLGEQESVFGRAKGSGAPLSGGSEFSRPDFGKVGPDGTPLIHAHSHMALAHPGANGGNRILRRAFNYSDADAMDGPDVGLFFMSYQRDLVTQYIPMQRRLAENDLLNEYIRHTGSASFAVPPGARGPGDYVGSTLLGS